MLVKKRFILFSALCLLLSTGLVFAGQGKKADDGVMTVRIFLSTSYPQPAEDNVIYKMIEDELKIRFEFEFLAGDLEQKLGVMIAGDDYPDVISVGNKVSKFIEAGALIPLEDLIQDNCPRLYAHYEPFWNKVKEPDDGHFYVMPNYGRYYRDDTTLLYFGGAMWMQKAVLAEFGYPLPRTLDDYFDLIYKYYDKYPTIDGKPTIGFEILTYGTSNWCLRNPPEYLMGYPNDGDVIVNQETYEAKMFAFTDGAKRYYKKLNEMNQLGLINKQSFVQTYDQYLANIASGRVLGFYDQKWQFQNGTKPLIRADKLERTYVPLPITYDESIRDWYRDRSPINLHNGYAITKACKDPVRVLKMFDTLLEERWQKILQWGIEGDDYYVDENGRFRRTPEQRDLYNDPVWDATRRAYALFNDSPKMEGLYSDGNACSQGHQPEEYYEGLEPYDKEFLAHYDKYAYIDFLSKPPENPKYYPCWQIDLIDGSPAQVANQRMIDLSMKYLPRLVLADPADFDSLWDEYVSKFDPADTQAYLDRINSQIQWRLENW